MHNEENPFIRMFIVFIFGAFWIGVFVDRVYMNTVKWKELEKRGLVEKIETSAGIGYIWKDEYKASDK